MKSEPKFTASSGNVFRDLEVAQPEEAQAKAELMARIAELIARKKLTQAAAAKLLGVDQPKVSALLRGRMAGFSTERLIRFLTLLGSDVQIVVRDRPRSRAPGHLEVVTA
ncbi:XRE family transcriptional regulator [Corallococcus sp. AB049A]|uniref:XRE family transcriptional regulator n=1 Tax=Corallococcus interemptor TaxID=2316720 RepID=A0A3A8PVA9_9BACT|nr:MULTISPECIES: helix-turn-helix transcriptional regulator [Corallococcus]RKH42641.1 XRE family transcriptional regulator [Corallococcus sp. AB050B]RKH60323.1 XRE family transcriptional regulator [Corallococcus interemptor]RKI53771.1 XRE family transcriptional regulator [Corallococcus sp. AB049A]